MQLDFNATTMTETQTAPVEEDLKLKEASKNNSLKEIFGAGTDVYETEPPNPDNPLFTLDNILLSPHNAALTLECRKRMSIEAASSIVNYLTDREKLNLTNIVNKEDLDI